MVWTKVKAKEKIKDSEDYIIKFEYFGRTEQAIVTQKVLDYLHINEINIDDEVFVSVIFPKDEKVFLIRKVELHNTEGKKNGKQ